MNEKLMAEFEKLPMDVKEQMVTVNRAVVRERKLIKEVTDMKNDLHSRTEELRIAKEDLELQQNRLSKMLLVAIP